MKLSSFAYFAGFGIKTVLFRKKDPILGTIILTDKCNLKCKHCSVNNITAVVHPYKQIKKEMRQLYDMGIRILSFCGGETFLWKDGEKSLRDLVIEAKKMGVLIVNVVTNGTFPIDLPEADQILLSLDGNRMQHNTIRGDTYDIIMENIQNATSDNICFYMAINQINKSGIKDVCMKAKNLPNVRAVSFNFHTPYPDTKELSLRPREKAVCCNIIARMMKEGAPVFNLKSAFPYLIRNSFPTPCHQCVVMENGKLSTCVRIDEGLLPTSLTIRFSLRQRMVYYLFWTAYSTKVDPAGFEEFFGVPLKKMYGFEFWLAECLGFLRKEKGVYHMTLKGAFYYHYYENFYTLSYIDKMWGLMRKEAFPKGMEL